MTVRFTNTLDETGYVSNVTAETPEISGTNFWVYELTVAGGTQQIVAAIADVAGNVGYATNTVVMTVVTNGSYSYSAAGCVTSITYTGTSGYTNRQDITWNSQYQITAVSTNGSECERNGYDALGRRVWNASTSSAGAWETNYFVYDGSQIIADVDSTGGLRRAYIAGPGIDNWIAMTVYTGATAKTYFYLTDHLGTVHALADETGNIVESYRFDAWGRVLGVYDESRAPLPASRLGNRYLWQGKEYSWRTGLYHNRHRVYDPITGRFLSKDPSGIIGGLNEFTYANNNPVNFGDSFGLMYGDINVTVVFGAIIGPVVTFGVQVHPSGIYPYIGWGAGGLGGMSGAGTLGRGGPIKGWQTGLQVAVPPLIAGQGGYAWGPGSWFWEAGIGGPPGASLTSYYLFKPWRWPGDPKPREPAPLPSVTPPQPAPGLPVVPDYGKK